MGLWLTQDFIVVSDLSSNPQLILGHFWWLGWIAHFRVGGLAGDFWSRIFTFGFIVGHFHHLWWITEYFKLVGVSGKIENSKPIFKGNFVYEFYYKTKDIIRRQIVRTRSDNVYIVRTKVAQNSGLDELKFGFFSCMQKYLLIIGSRKCS